MGFENLTQEQKPEDKQKPFAMEEKPEKPDIYRESTE